MSERDEFLRLVLPRLTEVDTALHNGDARPRLEMWSEEEPVTVFGAAKTVVGQEDVAAAFEWLATRFSDCRSFEYEVVAADARGDLGYVVGIEHTTASAAGAPPQAYSLRVTTILRRRAGEWKVVHRHADPIPDSDSTRAQVARVTAEQPGP